MNCIYCGYPHIHREKYKKVSKFITNGKRYDIMECLNYIENNFAAEDVMLDYCAAEIGVQNRHNKEVLAIWNKNKWRGGIASNASVFLPGIASLLDNNLIWLLTSLDSGTAQTFHKIRGVDMFDKVVENLFKYANTGGGCLRIKYIVIETLNDNLDDMDNFIELVEQLSKIHPDVHMLLSRDADKSQSVITEREVIAFAYMIKKAAEKGIVCRLFNFCFSQAEIDRIYTDAVSPSVRPV